MKNPMLNKDFLVALDHYPHNFTWVKIVALNWEEYPMEEITGRVTSGSINVDGKSAVRRTCSLSLIANDVNINDFYWGLNSKFEVHIGLENHIDSDYPDIIWFKQGIFLISSFSCTLSVNSYNINIQGKDKMCLLNGDVGGVVPSSWDFGKVDVTNEDGTISQDFYPIKDIILQAVHEYTQEPWQNINVFDLDDYGLELLEYIGDEDIYIALNNKTGADGDEALSQLFVNDKYAPGIYYVPEREEGSTDWNWNNSEEVKKFSDIPNFNNRIRDLNINEKNFFANPTVVKFDTPRASKFYTIAKISKGDVCGYRICDIVYPYDLIASPGDSLTSVLDKLVQMLGNFEYFFDIDGRFIFQKKKTYIDVSWNNIHNEHSISDEVWANNNVFSDKYSYIFDDNTLVSSIQNSPNLSNIKNDFSLWGLRKNGESSIPIHLRYAIDKKPKYYRAFPKKYDKCKKVLYANTNSIFKNDVEEGTVLYIGRNSAIKVTNNKTPESYRNIVKPENEGGTWLNLTDRERNGCSLDDKGIILINIDTEWKQAFKKGTWVRCVLDSNGNKIFQDIPSLGVFPSTETEIEVYHDGGWKTDSKSITYIVSDSEIIEDENTKIVDWREIIYQMANDYRRYYRDKDFNITLRDNNIINGVSYYPTGYTGYEKYYIDFEMNLSQGVVAYWRELYNPEQKGKTGKYLPSGIFQEDSAGDFTYNKNGWNPNILSDPASLNFWFDFLDTNGKIGNYSVCYIGQRTKAVNDDKIKAIYFKEIPNIIYYENDIEYGQGWAKPGYSYIKMNDWALFNLSSQGKCALDVLEEYLYSYSYPATAITLTTIPIFHLNPNSLIYLNDPKTGAIGEYIMQSFSLQLGNTSSMSITAVEKASRLH